MKFRWSQADPNPLMAAELARQCHISPLFAQCLINRGMSEPGSIAGFLEPRLKTLSDPFLLPGMAAAVDLLYRARETGEFITIFGDYDVDGACSSALLARFLAHHGVPARIYIPDRLFETVSAVALVALMVVSVSYVATNSYNPFIYFNF